MAFASLVELHASALLIGPDEFLFIRRERLVALASQYAVPAIEFVPAGGLISYGPSFTAAFRQAGIYVGKMVRFTNHHSGTEMPQRGPIRSISRQCVHCNTAGAIASAGLIAVPLKPAGSIAVSDALPCGVVFISDPDRVDDPSVDSLRQAFDLTYREAQVAIAIAHGYGLQAAAQSMGVAVTTARSQLQQAFTKTGTSHQAELTALVHRTLAPLRHV